MTVTRLRFRKASQPSSPAHPGVRRKELSNNPNSRTKIYLYLLVMLTPYLLVIFQPELIDPILQFIYRNSGNKYLRIVVLITMTILAYALVIPDAETPRRITVTRWAFVLVLIAVTVYVLLTDAPSLRIPVLGICLTAIAFEIHRSISKNSDS